MQKVITNTQAPEYMKDYDKNKESLYLKYRDVNNLGNATKVAC